MLDEQDKPTVKEATHSTPQTQKEPNPGIDSAGNVGESTTETTCERDSDLKQNLSETYERIRRSNDTAAIRRVNQGTRDLLNSLGFKP